MHLSTMCMLIQCHCAVVLASSHAIERSCQINVLIAYNVIKYSGRFIEPKIVYQIHFMNNNPVLYAFTKVFG